METDSLNTTLIRLMVDEDSLCKVFNFDPTNWGKLYDLLDYSITENSVDLWYGDVLIRQFVEKIENKRIGRYYCFFEEQQLIPLGSFYREFFCNLIDSHNSEQ